MNASITFRISPTAAEALSVDDAAGLYPDPVTITLKGAGRFQTYEITTTRRTAQAMHDDCALRADPEGGFEQPDSWRRACRDAARGIRAALAKAGE